MSVCVHSSKVQQHFYWWEEGCRKRDDEERGKDGWRKKRKKEIWLSFYEWSLVCKCVFCFHSEKKEIGGKIEGEKRLRTEGGGRKKKEKKSNYDFFHCSCFIKSGGSCCCHVHTNTLQGDRAAVYCVSEYTHT